ncbi:MAG: hypothetical protein ACTH30_10240 [Leucobacter sp.]
MKNCEHAPPAITAEQQSRPAPVREVPDWRRLEVALSYHADLITSGIAYADEHHTGVNQETADHIAHVLGRSLGSESALAHYAMTHEGEYAHLRDEYLTIFQDPAAPAWAAQLVDHFGTYLIYQTFPDATTSRRSASYPRKLSRLHVPTEITVDGLTTTVHVPASYGNDVIPELVETLSELRLAEDVGLQAFLSVPSVNALSGDIMEDFHNCYIGTWRNLEDAISELCLLTDREEEVADFASERHLFFDYLTPDYEALREELDESFALIEKGGQVYVFQK